MKLMLGHSFGSFAPGGLMVQSLVRILRDRGSPECVTLHGSWVLCGFVPRFAIRNTASASPVENSLELATHNYAQCVARILPWGFGGLCRRILKPYTNCINPSVC